MLLQKKEGNQVPRKHRMPSIWHLHIGVLCPVGPELSRFRDLLESFSSVYTNGNELTNDERIEITDMMVHI